MGCVVHRALSGVSRREPDQRLTPEDREAQREERIGVGEIRAGQLRDAAEAMAHRVAVQEQLARHAVHASLEAQVRVERLHQIVVALVGRERSEDVIGERADLAR